MSMRYKDDTTLDIPSLFDTEQQTRVIRSHRKPTEWPLKLGGQRGILLATIIIAGSIATLVGPSSTPSTPVESPLALPTVAPIVDVPQELPAVELPEDLDRAARPVSRSMLRKEFSRDDRIDIVLRYALAQRGEPYVFGADGPGSWDCSGLVMMAYRKIGIRLPHYTGTMIGYGRQISHAQLRPGDIIFPSSSHVGIYLGSNKMVVAPQPGDVVKIQKVYAFYAARRLV